MQSKTEQFNPDLKRIAEGMKALSHPARLMILQVLAERGTCICGDVVEELPLAQASVSRHLAVLKQANLIRGEIDGPRSCYCINREGLEELQRSFGAFFDGLPPQPTDTLCC